MSNTQIDSLVSFAAPRADLPPAGRPHETVRFENHFRHAGETSDTPPQPQATAARSTESRLNSKPADGQATAEREESPRPGESTDDQIGIQEAEPTGDAETTSDDDDATIVAIVGIAPESPAVQQPAVEREPTPSEVRARTSAESSTVADVDVQTRRDRRKVKAAASGQKSSEAASAKQPSPIDGKPLVEAAIERPVLAESVQPAGPSEATFRAPEVSTTAAEFVEEAEARVVTTPHSGPDSQTDAKPQKGLQARTDLVPPRKEQVDRPREQSSAGGQSAAAAAPVSAKAKPLAPQTSIGTDSPKSDEISEKSPEEPAAPTRAAVNSGRTANASAVLPAVPDAQKTGVEADTEFTLKTKDTASNNKDGLLSPLARFDRSGSHGPHGPGRSGEGGRLPQVDPARFVSRVARAIHSVQERGGGPLQIRLSPPELGAMRLELTVHQGVLAASIETENANARQVLLDHLPLLRDRLAEQNVRIERFDVDVRRDGQSGSGQGQLGPREQSQEQQQHHAPQRGHHARNNGGQVTPVEPVPVRRTITNTSINVIA